MKHTPTFISIMVVAMQRFGLKSRQYIKPGTMRLITTCTISCLILLACNKSKDDQLVKTFTGNLPIVQTTTPTSAIAGQDIISHVRCELSSISGSVYFQGFDVQETSPQQFSIRAKALYKDWNTGIGMPVMWTLDTIVSVKTTTPGTYILKFHNATHFLKSDTVWVN